MKTVLTEKQKENCLFETKPTNSEKSWFFVVISLKINANSWIITCSQFYKKMHSHYFRETPWKLDKNFLDIVKPQMKITFSPTKVRKFKGLICYWFLAQLLILITIGILIWWYQFLSSEFRKPSLSSVPIPGDRRFFPVRIEAGSWNC